LYDYLIVGSGLFGAVCARELSDKNKKCLVIDKRNHIGGNCYDIEWKDNIFVSLYGGHYGHTNNQAIFTYLNRFSKFYQYSFVAKAFYENTVYSYPINLMTLQQLWGIKTPDEARKKMEAVRIKIPNPKNFEEKVLSMVGKEIYEKLFYGYNKRHWGVEPSEVPASVINRIVVRESYDDRYFDDTYQYMPLKGYTELFKSLLNNIEVKLETPYEKSLEACAEKVIYTGCIDEYYNYCYDSLEYRGVEYQYTNEETGSAMITYPDYKSLFNRKFSYSYSSPIKNPKDFITAVEYPNTVERYYPVNTERNTDIYNQYKNIKNDKVLFGGRLGSYQYINMDTTVEKALELVKSL
jgi:UDP-galactopyranose mutase